MPAIVISAVDTANDKVTAVAHGLTSGDRCRVRNVGGALPTGLTAGVDIFAVRVDADNLKFSDTNAHAVAGTNIFDLTTSGSGTNTVEWQLPYCIPTRVAVPGVSQVASLDANNTWAGLVAIYSMLVGLTQTVFSAITFAVAVTFNAAVTFAAGITLGANQNVTISGTGQYKHGLKTQILTAVGGQGSSTFGVVPGLTVIRTGASGGTYYRPIDIDAGKRILNIRVRLKDAAGTTSTATLVRDVDGTQTTVSTIGTSAGSGAYQTLTASAINHSVTTGGQYAIAFTFAGAAANCDLNKIEVDYDEP